MDNVEYGVFLNRPRIVGVSYNRIASNQEGVTGGGPTQAGFETSIENNTLIANNHSAILFFGNNSKGKLRVKENNITLNGFQGIGIHADLVTDLSQVKNLDN